jgi:hypothetical protein
MTPFLTVVFGVLFGIAATCLAMLWIASTNDYAAAVLPGQRWKVKGLGVITIKETLSGGKYYTQYGNGTNVAYITERGRAGHCSRHAITKHGTLVRQMANVVFVNDDAVSDVSDNLHTYNRYGRINTDKTQDTIDAEFCDPVEHDNVYHLARRRNLK